MQLRLCASGSHILIRENVLAMTSDLPAVIASYLPPPVTAHGVEWRNPGDAFANPWFRPLRFYLGDEQGRIAKMPVSNQQPVYVWIEGEIEKEDVALNVGYALYDDGGTCYIGRLRRTWRRVYGLA